MSSRRSAMFKEEEWARVQPIIRKLYLLEDKSLKDVVTILSTFHNFRPSKAQLESKLRQWHMAKNMTSMEWKHVDMRIRKRRLQSKESKVYLSGIPLRCATVEKARGRHSIESTLDRFTGKAPPSPEDLSLIICTPSPPAEVQVWETQNIPWLLATNFLREFNLGMLPQSRHDIRLPVEELLSLAFEDHPKLFSHTSKLQYTMQSLALIMPAMHQEHHVFRAESLLLSPLSASITSESFELLLFLLTNNFLTNATSVEDEDQQSAITGLLLDMMQRSRVLDLFTTQPFATLPLSLQSALNRIFKEAVQRSKLKLTRQLLQLGVDVNQLLPDTLYDLWYIGPHRAFEYAVMVHDTELMDILSEFRADSRVENIGMVSSALRRWKRQASASERSIVYLLSNCDLRTEDHEDSCWIDQICQEFGSDMACPVSEHIIGLLRNYLRIPASVSGLLVTAIKSNSAFTYELLSEKRHLLNISNRQGETPLTAAVCMGSRRVVNHLLELGVDLNPPPILADENLIFASPLQCAAFIADINGIRQLLDAGADINLCHSSTAIYNLPASVEVEESVLVRGNTMDCLGKTALQAAILGRNTDSVLFLLAAGARLVGGELAMAIRSRQQSIIDAVLTKGPLLGDATGTEYGSVLEAAILTEDVDLISWIIEANPQAVDEPALSAAIFVARTTSNFTIIHHIMEEYAKKPVINDTWLGTAMNLAAQLDLLEVSELMLTSGLHPTTCCRSDSLSYSLRLWASQRQLNMPDDYLNWRRSVQLNLVPYLSLFTDAIGIGQLEYLKLLLRHDYQAPSFVNTEISSFESLEIPQSLEILQTLHRHGTRMTSRVLSRSILAKQHKITQWMLSLDLDLAETIPDDELRTVCSLRTPLQAAAERGDNTLLEKLRTLGANINEPPGKNAGVTALQAASIKGYYGLVKRLLDLQADPNAPGAAVSGRTALEGAAEHGRLDVVQLLLNSGVETCGSGRRQYVRAIEFARKECHHIVVKLLRSHRPWTEADQELLKDETLLQWDQTPEGIAKRREELEGHTAQAIDDDETTEYETSEYEDCDDEYSDNETSDDEASKDDAEEASLNRLPASTLEETREVLRIDDETPGLPGDAIWAEAYENWSSEFPWSME